MKKITLLAIIVFLTSCEDGVFVGISKKTPIAQGSINYNARGKITLVNTSLNAGPNIIDWGDGNVEELNGSVSIPHVYEKDGQYQIKLTVFDTEKRKKSDQQIISANISNTEGDFSIYLAKDFQDKFVSIWVDNNLMANIEKYTNFTGTVSCSTTLSGTGIKGGVKPGVHKYTAVSIPNGKFVWEGEFTVTNNGCKVIRLQ